jgi:MFS family permease
MQDDLGLGPEAWGWVTAAFAIGYTVFEIPSGYMADRFGARLMLTRIVVWWSAFTALTRSVSRLWTLLLVRFAFGAGEAGAYPTASASAFNWFPARERGRVFGLVWMFSQLGGAVAPLLIVPIQVAYGWRASFYIFGMIGVIWAVLWWWWYRDRPEEKPGVTAQELADIGPSQLVTRHSFPWKAIARNKSVWAVMGTAWCYAYAAYFFLFWLPTYLVRARGFTETELRHSALPFVLAGVGNLVGGLTAAAASVLVATATANKYAAVVWLGLCYSAITFQQPSLWAVCVDIGRRYAGAVAGCMNTAARWCPRCSLGGWWSDPAATMQLCLLWPRFCLLARRSGCELTPPSRSRRKYQPNVSRSPGCKEAVSR